HSKSCGRLEGRTRHRSRAAAAGARPLSRWKIQIMRSTRRKFLVTAATLTAGALAAASRDADAQSAATVPESIRALTPMMGAVAPITSDERRARLEKARRLMTENQIGAVVLEGGSSMFYFTGVRWGLSERPFVTVIPAKGDLAWVSPGFAEARARELIET